DGSPRPSTSSGTRETRSRLESRRSRNIGRRGDRSDKNRVAASRLWPKHRIGFLGYLRLPPQAKKGRRFAAEVGDREVAGPQEVGVSPSPVQGRLSTRAPALHQEKSKQEPPRPG